MIGTSMSKVSDLQTISDKILGRNENIKLSLTRPKSFDICYCISFEEYCQNAIFLWQEWTQACDSIQI